ncbi:MAG: guanosine polyphosphate pyrophosphohydrolase, partial [Ruminiclostridium sp.]|nr:guanosine polyphosphate pyrophosphohydrolase [Ruminiclostridium sp.]
MITLNDYLYSGDTVLKILHQYSADLRENARLTHNSIDTAHSNFLVQITEMLEHNDFLTSQSNRIKELYKYMTVKYPFLAFTFKGRIKSLIRAEEKFNGYIVEYVYDYYLKKGKLPNEAEIKSKLQCFRDLVAYRIVISLPKCHLKDGEDKKEAELKLLYEAADILP